MRISSLNAINHSIKKNFIISLISLLTLSLLVLNVIYFNNLKTLNQNNKNEIVSNINLLKAHLSEKISIIASSNVFVDYLRSGSVTQKSLKSDFIYDIKSLKLKEISGIKISSANGDTIFTDGSVSPYFVELPLCYFDRELDSTLGSCSHNLILYLNLNEIINSLKKINDNLIPCKNCPPINFLNDKNFGSFNVTKSSQIPIYFEIKSSQNFNIVTLDIIVLLIMIVLAGWTLRKTTTILQKYLSQPIKKITNNLKSGEELIKNDEIDELSYLIDEILDREDKLKLAKENEHLIAVGQISAQMAHDIRSPLAVLNSILETMEMTEQQRSMISNVSEQINDFANNLLDEYNSSSTTLLKEINEPNIISKLLDSLIEEKRLLYKNRKININFYVGNNADLARTNINASNFKRVISNIINNAADAIRDNGLIDIQITCPTNNSVTIMITDNGMGMKQDLIKRILNGESVTSKKNGAGIGLSSAYTFIKSWGGQLDIASEKNAGTSIIINLPIERKDTISMDNSACNDVDLILIDDNQSVIDAWRLSAVHKKKKIVTFTNIEDVTHNIEKFDRTTPIYIDSDLGRSIRGEQYAKSLYELGFKNIYLTTGYKNSLFAPMHWIKEVVGKEPRFQEI